MSAPREAERAPVNPTAGSAADPAALVSALAEALRARGECLATAESCTGGMIAAACTSMAGSSDWFDRGVVSYSNAAKTELLGVEAALIAAEGAVSEAVVRAMAAGMRQRSAAHWAVAVTGVAGPGGGTAAKPVGTVWIGLADARGGVQARLHHLVGDRAAVRQATVEAALAWVLQAVSSAAP